MRSDKNARSGKSTKIKGGKAVRTIALGMMCVLGFLASMSKSHGDAYEGLNIISDALQLNSAQLQSAQQLVDQYLDNTTALNRDGQILRDEMNRLDLGQLGDTSAAQLGSQAGDYAAVHTQWVVETQVAFYQLLNAAQQQDYIALKQSWADAGSSPYLPLGNWPVLCTPEFLPCEPGLVGSGPEPST